MLINFIYNNKTGSDNMLYSVDKTIFEFNPDLLFGILIGKGLKNSETLEEDKIRLRKAEKKMREKYIVEQVRELRCV